jgi:hypothetical protein
MIKFSIFHSEEFENPRAAFIFGVLVLTTNVLSAFTNLIHALTLTKIIEVVIKFVCFQILV